MRAKRNLPLVFMPGSRLSITASSIAFFMLLTACGDHGDTPLPVAKPPVAFEVPDHFLQVPDEQRSLAAGDYDIVAATTLPGVAGSYQISLSRDDGSNSVINGSWTASGGLDPASAANGHHALLMARPGGVKIALSSTVDTYLYLRKNGTVIAQDDNSGGGDHALIELAANTINSEAYARAYYRLVDPQDKRATLAGFKAENGFNLGEDAHAVFRDARDLGYGRNMHARRRADGGFAFFVENYVVTGVPGQSNYSTLNVEAAVREDRRYLFGINAIEFSPIDEADPASEKVLKFFTYKPESSANDAPANRLLAADLDGRGVKAMPGICLTCHGARILPLQADGSFPLATVRSTKYNQLEADAFEYAVLPGFARTDQEGALFTMNKIVRDSYVELGVRDSATPAHWFADFSIGLSNGRYDGFVAPTTFKDDFIPEGWQQTVARPEGVELLYKTVVEPHCLSCHALQGNSAGEAVTSTVNGQVVSLANSVNFASYEKFIANSERIIDYVYRRGLMPLSLRNYEMFWKNPDGAPALLASFLPGFDLYDGAGHVREAGLAVAKPGSNRRVRSPVRLDASASLFAASWAWRVLSAPAGAVSTFDDASKSAPLFSADRDGDYLIELSVSNGHGSSAPVTMVLTIDSSASDQKLLRFDTDIRAVLGSATTTLCANCHQADTIHPGIPVRYDDANPDLYRDVLARVNLADPENSRLLRKPLGTLHGGGLQLDRNTALGEQRYQTLLNWIREGAICGDDPVICH